MNLKCKWAIVIKSLCVEEARTQGGPLLQTVGSSVLGHHVAAAACHDCYGVLRSCSGKSSRAAVCAHCIFEFTAEQLKLPLYQTSMSWLGLGCDCLNVRQPAREKVNGGVNRRGFHGQTLSTSQRAGNNFANPDGVRPTQCVALCPLSRRSCAVRTPHTVPCPGRCCKGRGDRDYFRCGGVRFRA
jgi:hypothetical protein